MVHALEKLASTGVSCDVLPVRGGADTSWAPWLVSEAEAGRFPPEMLQDDAAQEAAKHSNSSHKHIHIY